MSKKTEYTERLKHPLWQKKRLEIFNRDDFTCQKCGDTEAELQVHHKKYIDGCEPWEYDDSLLITYCVKCHKAVEKKKIESQSTSYKSNYYRTNSKRLNENKNDPKYKWSYYNISKPYVHFKIDRESGECWVNFDELLKASITTYYPKPICIEDDEIKKRKIEIQLYHVPNLSQPYDDYHRWLKIDDASTMVHDKKNVQKKQLWDILMYIDHCIIESLGKYDDEILLPDSSFVGTKIR